MKAAASFSSFSRRPVITTCAPSSTKRLAVAKPIPLLPPVMTATLPSSFFTIFYPSFCVVFDLKFEKHGTVPGSELRQAAVDGDLAGGHEAAVVRREECSRRPELRRITHALERSHRAVGLQALLAQRFRREFGRYRPGRQHVYADAGALQVLRPGPREVAHCRLARAVGGERRGARGAGARSGQDDRTALAHQRQRLLDREDRTLHIDVEGFVDVLGGDLAELKLASHPGIGENDVERFALLLHRRVESVEVGLIRDRALHRAGIGPEVGPSGVEFLLPAAEDEDEGALFDEALCCGAADAGSATGDHGGLSRQFLSVIITHIFSSLFLFFVILKMWDLRFSYKADIVVDFAEFEQVCDVFLGPFSC